MTQPALQPDDLSPLLAALCDGRIAEDDFVRLERLLAADPRARWWYIAYMDLHGELCWGRRTGSNPKSANQELNEKSDGHSSEPQKVPSFVVYDALSSAASYPMSTTLQSWLQAYAIALVILGLGIFAGSLVRTSPSSPIADYSHSRLTPVASDISSKAERVGRITGMVDCRWEDTGKGSRETVAVGQKTLLSAVVLSDRFALRSGLLEITYDTGAKVLLQGPVNYEVESPNGGFMSIGKLTGRVTTKKARGLTIRTPVATVVDLGTEFGVEVSKEGRTTSYVYCGAVKVQPISDGGKIEETAHVLRENQSACVEPTAHQTDKKRVTIGSPNVRPSDFVREIPNRTVKVFDLVDVVAGGNGFTNKRDRGIDPSNGKIANRLRHEPEETTVLLSDRRYHRVTPLSFIDGVFIPSDSKKPVQVDSAGHTFAEFRVNENATWQNIWAGGAIKNPICRTTIDGIDYAVAPHGLLLLHANAAITFDLAAIRRANPGFKPVRFRTVMANTEPYSEYGHPGYADLWVLVDGQERYKRREINAYSGATAATVSIRENDRFLTLVTTDSGNGISGDFGVFGDPRLELLQVETSQRNDKKEP